MNEKDIITQLHECGTGVCKDCYYFPFEGCMWRLMEDAAKEIKRLRRSRDKWKWKLINYSKRVRTEEKERRWNYGS